MTGNGEVIVEVRDYGGKWWVCLGSKRIVGMNKRDACAVAYQIVEGLKELGCKAELLVDSGVTAA